MLDSVNIYFYFLTPVQLNLDSNIPRLSNPMDQSWEDLHKTDILIVDQPAHKTSQLSFLERNHSPILTKTTPGSRRSHTDQYVQVILVIFGRTSRRTALPAMTGRVTFVLKSESLD